MKHAISRLLLVTSTLGLCASAGAETTLRMAHLWPAGSAVNQDIYQAWANQVEQESNGQIKVEIYPSQTLAKADQAYDAAANGIADISVTLQGYTAGRFPLTEIVQLPGVANSASQGACILQTLYDEGDIVGEYSDTHVLFMFTTGPAYLHTRDTEIRTPADLQGLRIRRPSEVAGEMLASMGAQPLGMPAPDIYTALQAVIDDNSGMAWALKAGQVFGELDKAGREEAEAQGDTIHVVEDPLNDPAWAAPLKQGTENYLKRLEERGLDNAKEVYEKALALRERCEA
jgi:TRAP-type C4-dicarboxylate transport system substrate-binding protein